MSIYMVCPEKKLRIIADSNTQANRHFVRIKIQNPTMKIRKLFNLFRILLYIYKLKIILIT